MSDHESRVQTSVLNQEGRQVAERRVHQTLRPALAHRGQLVHSDRQVVQGLKQQSNTQAINSLVASGHICPLSGLILTTMSVATT